MEQRMPVILTGDLMGVHFSYVDRFDTEAEAVAIANSANVGLAGKFFLGR